MRLNKSLNVLIKSPHTLFFTWKYEFFKETQHQYFIVFNKSHYTDTDSDQSQLEFEIMLVQTKKNVISLSCCVYVLWYK